ncbi:chemosensory pili system protein ChpE [Nonomuraea solani]|uniref:Chemosensory pili system protein ChpE n=1 Tax=Nonomuraea solani TaxID=1144553 RepID=A0A1H6EMW1_9ACTN|nr:LysE family transporter [Nonomuraea solani]SEG99188.1 chemosensory pili system protein ChpE [Nonomuraea solani]
MSEIFMLAFWVGLVFNAAPGAVFSESLRRGVRGGFRPAFAVQVGSLAGDAVWALLGLAGVGALFTVPVLRVPLTVVGCLLLGWLGLTALRDAAFPRPSTPTEPHPEPATQANSALEGAVPSGARPGDGGPEGGRPARDVRGDGRRGALVVGAAMSLGNPWNIVYWSGAAGAVSSALGQSAGLGALAVFFAGFMTSSLAWCFVSAGLIALLRRALPPLAVRLLEAGCGVALLVFAVLLAIRLA